MSINGVVRMRALEIEDDVLDAILGAGEEGCSFQEACAVVGMEYMQFYGAVLELARLGKVKIVGSRNGNMNRIVMPGWEPPALGTLTEKQQAVLSYLISKSDSNQIVRASGTEINRATNVGVPQNILEALDKKGFLQFLDLGGPTRARLFKLYPEGDGPRGSSWWNVKHGRPCLMDIAEYIAETDANNLKRKEKDNADAS